MQGVNVKGFCSLLKICHYHESSLGFFWCIGGQCLLPVQAAEMNFSSIPSRSSRTEPLNASVDNFIKLLFSNTHKITLP